MGASRRLFVRSDEEDEDSGDLNGDGAGPSTCSATRKTRKISARQTAPESHSTAGESKKLKRRKRAPEKTKKDSDSDWEMESSEYEEIPATAWRQKWSQNKVHKELRNASNRKNSKETPMPSVFSRKKKQNISSARKTSHAKAKFSWYEDRFNGSIQKQTGDDAHIYLGEDFENLLFEEALNASKETYTKEIDIPERFEMHEEILNATEAMKDWTIEAHWIYDRIFGDSTTFKQDEELNCFSALDKEEVIKEIVVVLMQLHLEKLEVPVIGMYKYQECTNLANRSETKEISFGFRGDSSQLKSFKALWIVFQWDRKWLSLLCRKKTQKESWKNRAMTKEIGSAAEDRTLDGFMQALQEADSEVAIDDLDAKFSLQILNDERGTPKGQYKRPKRQSFYGLCCKSGLRELASQLGLTPEQLGENLHALQKIHEPLDLNVPPEKVNLSCARGQFSDLQRALEGARHMAAYELSCEPRVRKFVRSLFDEHAVVSTTPTSKGKILIDSFHEFACVKHVQAKSVKNFSDGEWLLIQKAEEDELVEVRIEMTQEVFNGVLIQTLQDNYFSNASIEVSRLWNDQRKLVLQEALSQMLLPILVRDTRLSLTARAKAWVEGECSKSLWKRVSMAPYPSNDRLFPDASTRSKISNESEGAMVLACCWGTRQPPTTFVMLDTFGELVDTLQTGYLNVHPGSHIQQLQRKLDDQERLKKFILLHKPNVVVVGAVVNIACRHLKDTIAETVGQAAEVNSALTFVPVIYGDESLASLYEKSQVSLMQLPKQPSIIRRAVALGRSLQNPLAVIAALCNPSKDIVALSMHQMQRFLSAEELYTSIESVMVTVTNQIGVDVNLAVGHEWLFSPLQFACGLGWKKASKIQQLVKESGWLPSRESLFKYPFSLRDVVFRNCSASLRIRRVGHALSGLRKFDPLDDTRIHPDYYELARDLAIYAFTNGQVSLESEKDVDIVEQAIVHFRQNPDSLTKEIVGSFLSSLETAEVVNMEFMKDICSELLCGFSDFRAPYSRPTQDEEFTWLTGEDEASLCIGKAVNVVVQKVFRHRAICTLESRLRGVLEKEDFTSESNVDLTQVLSEGSTLTCRVANVLKDQFCVQLSCLENGIEDLDSDVSLSHARSGLCSEETVQNLGQSSSKGLCFKPRDIHHPLFQNISISDTIKALFEENPGKVIFHPSSEGPACLSMTLKCQDNVYIQKEIEELEKDSTDLATFSRLGSILKVDGRNFSSLDEVVNGYASPLMNRMNEVLQSRQFQSGGDSEIRSFLNQEKEVSSDSLVYCFSLCPNNLGAITISYMVGEKVITEQIDLYPEGYGLQNKMFRKMETVVECIKKTVNDAGCRWGDPDKERNKRGDGIGRGRGGRFGSARRGRGFQGRGGRGNGFSGKWGLHETENNEWSSAGAKNEQKQHEGHEFNSWAAEKSNGWNEKKPGFESSKNQDDSNWGVTGGLSEKFEGGWGADNSNNAEKHDLTGWHIGGEKGATEETGKNEKGDGLENDSGWGDADVQLDEAPTGSGGWGAIDSKNTENGGWGALESTNTGSGGWGASDCRQILQGEETGGNGKGDRFEASNCRNDSGWVDADVQLGKASGSGGWGATTKKGGRGTADVRWALQDDESHKQRGDGRGRGRSRGFGSGQRGRGFQGRGGRGNRSSWGSQERENRDYSSDVSHMNECKKHREQGFDNFAAEKLDGWHDQKVILDACNSHDESGWGADDSGNVGTTGWGAAGSHLGGKQSVKDKPDLTGWHSGGENSGNRNKAGFEATRGRNDTGWDDTDDTEMHLDKGTDSGKGGWGAADFVKAGQDEESHKQRGNGTGRGHSGRFGPGQRGRGFEQRAGSGNSLSGRWGPQEMESGNLTIAESRKNEQQVFNNRAVGESSWNEQGMGLQVSRNHGKSDWGTLGASSEKFKSGWEVGDSKDTEKQEMTGWHVWEETGATDGTSRNAKEEKVEAYDSGWGTTDAQLNKGQTGFGWGANDWKNTEKGGWGAAGCFSVGQDEEVHKQRGYERGRGRGRGGRFGSGQRGRGFVERSGRENRIPGKWGPQEAESSDWNSADSHRNELKKHEERGFNNYAAGGSKSWNEQRAGFEFSKNQGEIGWGFSDGSLEKVEIGWGAGDSKTAEKQQITGGHAGDDNGVADGNRGKTKGDGVSASKSQNGSGWGDADVQSDKGQTGFGWGVSEGDGVSASKSQNGSGWGDADAQSDKGQTGFGWGVSDSKKTEKGDWGAPGLTQAGVSASKSQNGSGWGDGTVQSDKGQTGFGWGVGDSKKTEKGGWGAPGLSRAGQDEENYKQRGDGRGYGRGGRFGPGRRGRGFGGRGGRGNSWGLQEMESNNWNSANSHRSEHKKHEAKGFKNWAAGESTSWKGQKAGFDTVTNQGESGWEFADGSLNKFESGWGADDSKKTEKQGMASWQGNGSGATEGNEEDGFEASNGQDDAGWGDTKKAEKQGMASWQGNGSGGTEGNEKEDGFETSNGQDDAGWGDTNVQLDKGSAVLEWGANDSKSGQQGGWEAAGCTWTGQQDEIHKQTNESGGKRNSLLGVQEAQNVDWNSAGSCRNVDKKYEEKTEIKSFSEDVDGWKDPSVEVSKTGSPEEKGWGVAGHTCVGQDEFRDQQKHVGTGQLPGNSFEAKQGGQGSVGRGNSSSGKWEAEDTDKRDWNSADAFTNEHRMHIGHGFNNCSAEELHQSKDKRDWNSADSFTNEHIDQGFNNCRAEEMHQSNEQKAISASFKDEESKKESLEVTGDGIWGACEDLIDSNEMEGLISH
ncbi:hypothetical protein L7F22_065592 [Adiantum nelumboides]|nr:hypothetical protein [Adiantum nelumboides]